MRRPRLPRFVRSSARSIADQWRNDLRTCEPHELRDAVADLARVPICGITDAERARLRSWADRMLTWCDVRHDCPCCSAPLASCVCDDHI